MPHPSSHSRNHPPQFSLRQMLLGITLLAVALVACRGFISLGPLGKVLAVCALYFVFASALILKGAELSSHGNQQRGSNWSAIGLLMLLFGLFAVPCLLVFVPRSIM